MTSPTITYASPQDSHTPIGSPASSQILLRRVASPNHLASAHHYVESPRSVPVDYSQYEQLQREQFQYEQPQEMYVTDDPHIYDFGPNGPLPVEPQFAQPEMGHNGDASHFMYMVLAIKGRINSSLPSKYSHPPPCSRSLQITSTTISNEV